jgi:hypothetical protein
MFRSLLCAVTLALGVPGGDAGPAKLGIDEIIRGIEANEKAWRAQGSWMVRYSHSRERINPAPGSLVLYPDNRLTNARKGPWLFAREEQDDGPGPRPAITGRNTWVLWKDGVYTERDRHNARIMDGAQVMADQGTLALQTFYYPGALFRDFHSDTLAVPEEFFKGPSEAAFVLPRCLKADKAEYRIRKELEEIDDSPCHVIKRAGKDVIWLDAGHGYNVRRRTLYWPSGGLCAEFKASGFAEKAPGIWLPARQVSVAFNRDTAPPGYRGKVMFVLINRLEESRFGDVPDSLFEIPLLGVRVLDFREKKAR